MRKRKIQLVAGEHRIGFGDIGDQVEVIIKFGSTMTFEDGDSLTVNIKIADFKRFAKLVFKVKNSLKKDSKKLG